jgi:tellurite resistance protein
MSHFPPPLMPPPKVGLFRRVPPAMFLPIFGLLGLVLAWKHGARAFSLPMGPVELATGMAMALFLFGLGAYLAKFILRPKTCVEDLGTLPGRSGLAAMGLCWIVLASLAGDILPGLAGGLLVVGVTINLAIALFVTVHRLRGTDQAGPVTPGMHLVYVGFILIPGAAAPLGAPIWALELICAYCMIAALIVTVLTLGPLLARNGAPPLRPLQGIQLAPWALLTTSCILTGHPKLATIALICATLIAGLLVIRLPWLIEGGFSGFWSAFTFPVAAFAGSLLIYAEAYTVSAIQIAGGVLLILVTLYIPVIAFKILKLWATGTLAIKTNAATA